MSSTAVNVAVNAVALALPPGSPTSVARRIAVIVAGTAASAQSFLRSITPLHSSSSSPVFRQNTDSPKAPYVTVMFTYPDPPLAFARHAERGICTCHLWGLESTEPWRKLPESLPLQVPTALARAAGTDRCGVSDASRVCGTAEPTPLVPLSQSPRTARWCIVNWPCTSLSQSRRPSAASSRVSD